jgi:SAM-dependent MidA family methyltransferase
MSIHEFMRRCLSHPLYGYYTTKDQVFGAKGDYITAPDISPMFGEVLVVPFPSLIIVSCFVGD